MTATINDNTATPKAWWSRAILVGAIIAAALLPIGALGTRFGLWPFTTGFLLLAAATVLAVIGFVTGIGGIIITRARPGRPHRPGLYRGTVICAVILVLMGLQFSAAAGAPRIHDISTDVIDPPQFDRIVALRGEQANPLNFDAATIAPEQRKYYPWVDTLRSDLAPDAALDRAVSVLKDMGLDIVNVDQSGGRVEATATTFWFGFKDDVVVRVRLAPGGSFVDMRSVSRVGESDLGKNAKRIRRFLEAFRPTS